MAVLVKLPKRPGTKKEEKKCRSGVSTLTTRKRRRTLSLLRKSQKPMLFTRD